jgi:hypothetical protein
MHCGPGHAGCGLGGALAIGPVLGLRAAPKKDSAVSSGEMVLGSQLILPGQFLDMQEWPLQDLESLAGNSGRLRRPLRG